MMDRRTFLALPLAARGASRALYSRLLASFEGAEAIDTHEHILPESQRVSQQVDFFTLASHYAINDVISAGLPEKEASLLEKGDATAAAKWQVFEPYWRFARFTGYGEALRIAIRDIYGFAEISGATLPRINQAIGARNKVGLYRDILKRRAKLRFCVNDEYWQPVPTRVDLEFFVLARKFDWLLTPITTEGVHRLEKLTELSITNLSALKQALRKHFELALSIGMVTVKSTMAYQRDLYFAEVPEAEAAAEFDRLMRGEEKVPEGFRSLVNRPYRKLSDYMFHYLVQLADAHHVPFQIHTGLQAGNGNFVTNTNPTQLTNLFFLYPRVSFDLFHIGFPYWRETAVLAKTFPNVYVDFCWMHIVSPHAARSALHEMLDMVPANKLFGFGGDYRYPELTYAHLVMARRNIAQVLSERVEAKSCSEAEALQLGRWLLHDNAAQLFAPNRDAGKPRGSAPPTTTGHAGPHPAVRRVE